MIDLRVSAQTLSILESTFSCPPLAPPISFVPRAEYRAVPKHHEVFMKRNVPSAPSHFFHKAEVAPVQHSLYTAPQQRAFSPTKSQAHMPGEVAVLMRVRSNYWLEELADELKEHRMAWGRSNEGLEHALARQFEASHEGSGR